MNFIILRFMSLKLLVEILDNVQYEQIRDIVISFQNKVLE